ncbi:ABC transporter ATP-binding protein [Nonomuraea sp. KC401]|uniref:ABC transporter ATP-binding protein n=1 Tax=unclassified Nonomuraea TaxID=2593643 RepID=UPI0010FEC005|nr:MULTISPECIES: ABC transporter ATP-binding protein [unclassified Nonomuraea]NBE93916.1 dipeptide ABC transporter ATP-binding protein [Nonomuraea sp. K271]TLF76288.1 ABC transporter ATP-binding protein [Nonomuraea sp. KC401]
MTTGTTTGTETGTTPSDTILAVERLSVDFQIAGEWTPAVKDVSFSVAKGEVVALVGESGSGKSVSSMSVLGLLGPNARRRGSIRFGGTELLGLDEEALRAIRGRRIAMIFQEPMTALNPVYTIGEQIVEAIQCHEPVPAAEARARTLELLKKVGIPEPERRMHSYPHQLSGGQRQRAMIAMAVSGSPEVIIADEPTTALDVTVQAEILELLRRLREDLGSAVVIITHDMGVVADLADRVVVMREGQVVEEAPVTRLFSDPRHEYTRKLLSAVPRQQPGEEPEADADDAGGSTTLRVADLEVEYPGRLGRKGFKAVHGVSVTIEKGKVLGLVGESGSGKSTIGRAIVGLVRASAGSIEICGQNVTSLKPKELRGLRRKYSMVFQDPGSSLNPRLSIGDSIAAPMIVNRYADRRAVQQRVLDLLDQVELPTGWADRFPHELSGGQRQRVGIARALALDPELLIADEPTSALDVSVQATVLRLFQDLQDRLGFSCLFISHDLGVVELLSHDVAVLQHGRLVESGPARDVLRDPRTDYTRRLIAAAPVPDPVEQAERRRLWREMAG